MLLFEHKQHLQSYNAQSSMQREIFAFKETVFLRTTTNDWKGLHDIPPRVSDTTNPKIYINPAPWNTIYRLSRQNMLFTKI